MQYQPPVNDLKFILFDVLGVDQLQTLDKYAVAGNSLSLQFLTAAIDRRAFADEPALGANRHNHRVLDLLCLDQTQYLGAEIFVPV